MIEDRIDGLLRTERAVLEAAAIEGRRFHRDAVSELIGPEHRVALDEALVALVRRDLIRPDHAEAGYRFSHTLVWAVSTSRSSRVAGHSCTRSSRA